MKVLEGLFKSKTWWTIILAMIWEVVNSQFGIGVTPGAGLVAPVAMSLRSFGKEAGGK